MRRIAITGSSGFIGRALTAYFEQQGDQVLPVHRVGETWDPAVSFEGLDAIVHLAGRSISARWTDRVKGEILESRVRGTLQIAERIQRCKCPPALFFCASAVGIYGDRGEEVLTEGSHLGDDFLAHVAREWEAASRTSTRVVNGRFGMVLGGGGGVLAHLKPMFQWGLGGPVGTGRQWVSWIALSDLVRAVDGCMRNPELSGPVNFVAPHPMRQAEFAAILAHSLRRPCLIRWPEWLISLLMGEMGHGLLLASQRVLPHKLEEAGFRFCKPTLDMVLKDILLF